MRDLVARFGAVTFAVAALAVLVALPAGAAGAGGVEMTVHLDETADDRLLLEVGDEPVTTTVTLENLTTDAKSVDVYPVDADVDGSSVVLGAAGSASWLGFDRTTVELGPDETRSFTFTTDRATIPEDGGDVRHAALVMELSQGSSVIVRAATVVRVRGSHALPPFTMVLVALATVLLVGTGYWLTREVSRRRRERSPRDVTAAV